MTKPLHLSSAPGADIAHLFGLRAFNAELRVLMPGDTLETPPLDTLIYVVEGYPTVRGTGQSYLLKPGDCLGFPSPGAHMVQNPTDHVVKLLAVAAYAV